MSDNRAVRFVAAGTAAAAMLFPSSSTKPISSISLDLELSISLSISDETHLFHLSRSPTKPISRTLSLSPTRETHLHSSLDLELSISDARKRSSISLDLELSISDASLSSTRETYLSISLSISDETHLQSSLSISDARNPSPQLSRSRALSLKLSPTRAISDASSVSSLKLTLSSSLSRDPLKLTLWRYDNSTNLKVLSSLYHLILNCDDTPTPLQLSLTSSIFSEFSLTSSLFSELSLSDPLKLTLSKSQVSQVQILSKLRASQAHSLKLRPSLVRLALNLQFYNFTNS
ncbi:hypothetical protein Bca4012_090276 [Brassica carinata]